MTNAAHAKLAPSSAFRRVVCPGSRALEASVPDLGDTAASSEGTLAHEVLSCYMTGAPLPDGADDDMIGSAKMVKELVKGITTSQLHVEERTDISTIHPGCWGTPDLWFQQDDTLYVLDYKYGRRPIEVFENWQLIEYAAGVLDTLDPTPSRVAFYIVQPRSFHVDGIVRTWEVSTKSLLPYLERLRKQEALAAQDVAPTQAGSHCRYCKARHICSTLRSAAYQITEAQPTNPEHQLDANALGVELQYLLDEQEILNARISGLEEQAAYQLRSGKRVPFFSFVAGRGRTKWDVPATEVIALGELLDIDLTKPKESLSPTQAKKAGLPQSLIASYSEKIDGAMKLTLDRGDKARKIFGEKK